MKTDEIIELADFLQLENKKLRRQNEWLKEQLRQYRRYLESALNILEPEQLEIIRKNIIDLTI